MKRPGRPMFRVVLLLLAWATAGAIVNVAVAWGTEMLVPLDYSLKGLRTNIAVDSKLLWERFASPTWTHGDLSRVDEALALSGDIRVAVPANYGWGGELGEDCVLYTFATGVPFRSLRSSTMAKLARQETQTHCGCHLPAAIPIVGGKFVNVCPLWPGFAINTVFYGVILWGLFAAPFALRKRRRIKRGLCPKCAYPVGASEVCTECGAAVTPKKAVTA